MDTADMQNSDRIATTDFVLTYGATGMKRKQLGDVFFTCEPGCLGSLLKYER